MGLPYDLAIPHLDMYPKRAENKNSHKNLYMTVHNNTIRMNQKWEPECPSTDERIKKKCYSHTMKYKNAQIVGTWINHKKHAKWKKSDINIHILFDSIFMKYPE